MKKPAFSPFFRAVHGHDPFPWQERLADEVIERGWPELLDLPTGSGKTSTIDIALYALARSPERMPRRIVLVVDRRIVVDQAAEHARGLRRALVESPDEAARSIADALRALWRAGSGADPFRVAELRGGAPRDDDWAKRPDQPVVGVSTVDQVGSRLLFRGYGVGQRSASIHAGLFGNDTLFLLDEVHLAVPFAETLQAITQNFRASTAAGLPDRFIVVRMSATPGERAKSERVFALDKSDRTHPVLAQRLAARKPARLLSIKVKGDDEREKRHALAAAAIERALELQRDGAAVVGVVFNRVDTARFAWRLLDAHKEDTESMLITGRMRPLDRDRLVRDRLLPGAGAERARGETRRLIVVATQCIEAGADLDFDGLVSECASLDALRQRFGRLDRRGLRTREHGSARAFILCRSDLENEREVDPVYGTALSATWRSLQKCASGDVVDFGIDALSKHALDLSDLALLSPRAHAPILLPAHLDAWAQTSPPLRPSPDPDIALWLHGPERTDAEVQIVWRSDVTDADLKDSPEGDDHLLESLSLVRPSSLEALAVPIHAARAWLNEREDSRGIADVLGEALEDERLSADTRKILIWTRETPLRATARELRPGDLLVVPASYGGLNAAMTFDPDDHSPVTDLGDLAQLRGRGLACLRLDPAAAEAWALPSTLVESMPRPDAESDETADEMKKRIAEWALGWPDKPEGFSGTDEEWRRARSAFQRPRRRPAISPAGSGLRFVLVQPVRGGAATDATGESVTEDEGSAFTATEVTLARHSRDVQALAEEFSRALGFSEALVRDIARAAWFHDVGKCDPRFQRWLAGGSEIRAAMAAEPLAKSALPPQNVAARELARRRAGYPHGYRHELLSLAMIEQNPEAARDIGDFDLVLHLVSSHHGWCRPFAPPLDHPEDLAVALDHDRIALQATTRHGLARLDSGVADRFWRLIERYGWWGLAWMEAVLRLADHRASEEEAGS